MLIKVLTIVAPIVLVASVATVAQAPSGWLLLWGEEYAQRVLGANARQQPRSNAHPSAYFL